MNCKKEDAFLSSILQKEFSVTYNQPRLIKTEDILGTKALKEYPFGRSPAFNESINSELPSVKNNEVKQTSYGNRLDLCE